MNTLNLSAFSEESRRIICTHVMYENSWETPLLNSMSSRLLKRSFSTKCKDIVKTYVGDDLVRWRREVGCNGQRRGEVPLLHVEDRQIGFCLVVGFWKSRFAMKRACVPTITVQKSKTMMSPSVNKKFNTKHPKKNQSKSRIDKSMGPNDIRSKWRMQ